MRQRAAAKLSTLHATASKVDKRLLPNHVLHYTLLQSPSDAIPAPKSFRSFAHAHVPVEGASKPLLFEVQQLVLEPRLDSAVRRLDGLVEQERLADVFYLGYRALQVEGF
jgi:hypothetical protein